MSPPPLPPLLRPVSRRTMKPRVDYFRRPSGLVKILAQLSAAERGSIEQDALLLPDADGPRLLPASSLVYDDAPWLSGRVRQLHLVHPDVGDEVSRKPSVAIDDNRQCRADTWRVD